MENIIEVNSLEKVFANQTAIESVDFQVKKGEIFGFLSPSGSGKTTTIKILTGQLTPTSGTAKVFGESVSQLKNQNTEEDSEFLQIIVGYMEGYQSSII